MSAAAIPFASLAPCGADPAPAALPSITAVHVRLRTDIVNLYDLSVLRNRAHFLTAGAKESTTDNRNSAFRS
jgi:hypothetical protein